MKLSELDNKYKMFDVKMVSGDVYLLSGEKLENIFKSHQEYFIFDNGEGFRKSSISNWTINVDQTRKNVIKNKPKLLEENNG